MLVLVIHLKNTRVPMFEIDSKFLPKNVMNFVNEWLSQYVSRSVLANLRWVPLQPQHTWSLYLLHPLLLPLAALPQLLASALDTLCDVSALNTLSAMQVRSSMVCF